MTISSSLNAGVMGLSANATRLAAISDNIANSATHGYKRTEVSFASLVLQQQNAAYAAGGVRSHVTKNVGETGSLISTGNALDIAVSGRGMLPVTNVSGVNQPAGARDLMLIPTGSFRPDQNGHLRTPSGLYLLGWPANTSGDTGSVARTSGANLEPVNLAASQFVAEATRNIRLGINLPAEATAATATPEVYTLPIEYYDNIGRANTLTFAFSPVTPATGTSNSWQVDILDGATSPATSVGTLTLDFADTPANPGGLAAVLAGGGAAYDATTGQVRLTLASGPVDVFVGSPGARDGITQLAGAFSPSSVIKDGAPISDLQSVEIDENGFLQAVYNTGFRRTLYQIPIGDTTNINGLQPLDNQAFAISADSGSLFLWDAGSGPVGSAVGFALMESTTDIASELTDLIETQRSYSSNAKIIQTVDEMLQETTNLKR
jgi:flagellar hook protein FlgE